MYRYIKSSYEISDTKTGGGFGDEPLYNNYEHHLSLNNGNIHVSMEAYEEDYKLIVFVEDHKSSNQYLRYDFNIDMHQVIPVAKELANKIDSLVDPTLYDVRDIMEEFISSHKSIDVEIEDRL